MNKIISILVALTFRGITSDESSVKKFNKIVGGFPINITDAPYQVSMQYFGSHLCGGSIISDKWVITAAHCTADIIPDPNSILSLEILVGATDLTEADGVSGEKVKVKRIIQHEMFGDTPIQWDFDLSLIELMTPITFSNTKRVVSLPSSGERVKEGALCFVSGWGSTQNVEQSSVSLRAVLVPYMSPKNCIQYYPEKLSSRMICGGYEEGGKDTCQGDSGGPMVCEGKLFGITSWGAGCAVSQKPGVYTKITALSRWIKRKMRE